MTGLFPDVTDADKLACAKRELEMRYRVYPRWVDAGKMTNEKAAWEIKVMDEIVKDYESKVGSPAG